VAVVCNIDVFVIGFAPVHHRKTIKVGVFMVQGHFGHTSYLFPVQVCSMFHGHLTKLVLTPEHPYPYPSLKELSKSYKVYAIDLLGFGRR
jgi:hypothetical protein